MPAAYWWERAGGAAVRALHYLLTSRWQVLDAGDRSMLDSVAKAPLSICSLLIPVVLGIPVALKNGWLTFEYIGYSLDVGRYKCGLSQARLLWAERLCRKEGEVDAQRPGTAQLCSWSCDVAWAFPLSLVPVAVGRCCWQRGKARAPRLKETISPKDARWVFAAGVRAELYQLRETKRSMTKSGKTLKMRRLELSASVVNAAERWLERHVGCWSAMVVSVEENIHRPVYVCTFLRAASAVMFHFWLR